MKKILFILALLMPFILSAQPDIINFDNISDPDSTWQSIDLDTLYFSKDSTYITGTGDTIKLVVDDQETLWLFDNAGTAQALFGDGSAAKPSMSFISQGNMGIYRSGSNNLAFSIAAAQKVRLSTSFMQFGSSGGSSAAVRIGETSSVTNPFIVPLNDDDDTGIGHPSSTADMLSLIAGGVEGIRIAEGGGNVAVQINGSNNYAVDVQGDDDYEIDIGAITQLTEGMTVTFKANTTNTDGATLEITSVGDLDDVLKMNDQALVTGDIEAGQIVVCVFDGTNWQMTSQLAQ